MHIEFSELTPSQRYHVMTQTVVPRPIAWVLTASEAAQTKVSYNLAPFSYFNAMCSDPALVVLSVGKKAQDELKDTRRNILERKNLVIHIPHTEQASLVTASAATLPHGESEIEKLGLSLVEEAGWPLPRLAMCSIAMHCRLYDYKEIGPNQQGILFVEILAVHVDDAAAQLDKSGRIKIDAAKIAPLARLGANEYASFGEVFALNRPK